MGIVTSAILLKLTSQFILKALSDSFETRASRIGHIFVHDLVLFHLDRLFLLVKQKANNGVHGRTAEVLGILTELTLFPLLPL